MTEPKLNRLLVGRTAWGACLAAASGDHPTVEKCIGNLVDMAPDDAALISAAIGWASILIDENPPDLPLMGNACSGGLRLDQAGRRVGTGDYADSVSETAATVVCAVANGDRAGAIALLTEADALDSYLACRALLIEAAAAISRP